MSFAADIAKFVERAKGNIDTATRQATVLLAQGVILKSPVGNPELWAENAHAVYARETHNLFVDAINSNLTKGEKRVRRAGKSRLREMYPLPSGEMRTSKRDPEAKVGSTYVGGRFRANWMFGSGVIPRETVEAFDRSGQATIKRLVAQISNTGAGGVTYLSNSLPYAVRLENGWSQQAPQGMVKLTVQEFQHYVSQAAKDANK